MNEIIKQTSCRQPRFFGWNWVPMSIALLAQPSIGVIIGGGGQDDLRVLGHDVVGMDKIKFCIRVNAVKKRESCLIWIPFHRCGARTGPF